MSIFSKSNRVIKVISIFIIQAFLIVNLSWAMPGESSFFREDSTLSPMIQIGLPSFATGFQVFSAINESSASKVLKDRFVAIDPLLVVRVEDVKIVETLSEPHAPAGEIESKVELMHPQNMAAVEVLKWVNDVGSKFAKAKADGAGARWTEHYYNIGLLWMMGSEVISEGERDKAGMIPIDAEVGGGWGNLDMDAFDIIKVDIAGDVVELTNGTNNKKILGTVSVATYSERGKTLNAPDIYITKWVVGPQAKG